MAAENNSTAFHFIQHPGRSQKLAAEVEIVFGDEAGVLSGMKLVGVCIWKSDTSHLFVTLPAKQGKRGRYFDFLRPAKPGNGTAKALKEAILREWEALQAAAASVA
jgi:DNA-binding cell septation regulator SpoVG